MKQEKIKGIYLFNSETDLAPFFKFCEKSFINFICTTEYFYLSKEFQKKAKALEIKICLSFSVYFDKEYTINYPVHYSIDCNGNKAIADWLHFVCPSQTYFIEYQKNRLREILDFHPSAMICFDFIRFFVFWEKIYPGTSVHEICDGCYCEKCINNFQTCTDITIKFKSPKWIKENLLKEWADWKCQVIQKSVADLADIVKAHNKDNLVGINLVPWQEWDFNGTIRAVTGQDIQLIKNYIDFFIPMTYSHMLKKEPHWIRNIVSEIHSRTGKQVLACIEIEKTYVDEEISENEFIEMVQNGSEAPSKGIILFHYDYILNTPKSISKILHDL